MRSTLPSHSEEDEERAAGFVLFTTSHQQRRYLLLQHQGARHWGFPKGRLEPGESEMTAALRETLEETSLSDVCPISNFRRTTNYTVVRDGRHIPKTVAYFLAETAQANVALSDEHTSFLWLAYDEAIERLTYAESRRVLEDAERWLARSGDSGEADDLP